MGDSVVARGPVVSVFRGEVVKEASVSLQVCGIGGGTLQSPSLCS